MSHEESIADVLLSRAEDKSVRQNISQEIFHSLLAHPTLQTQEFKALLITLRHAAEDFEREHKKYWGTPKEIESFSDFFASFLPRNNERYFYPSGYETLVRNAQRAMAEYCSRQEIFEKYVKHFRKEKIELGMEGEKLASQLMQPKTVSVVKTTARTVSPSPLSDWRTWVIIASSVNAAAAQPFVNKVFGSNAENVTGGRAMGDAQSRVPKTYTVPVSSEKESTTNDKKEEEKPPEHAAEKKSFQRTLRDIHQMIISATPDIPSKAETNESFQQLLKKRNYREAFLSLIQIVLKHPQEKQNQEVLVTVASEYYVQLLAQLPETGWHITVEQYAVIKKQLDAIVKLNALMDELPDSTIKINGQSEKARYKQNIFISSGFPTVAGYHYLQNVKAVLDFYKTQHPSTQGMAPVLSSFPNGKHADGVAWDFGDFEFLNADKQTLEKEFPYRQQYNSDASRKNWHASFVEAYLAKVVDKNTVRAVMLMAQAVIQDGQFNNGRGQASYEENLLKFCLARLEELMAAPGEEKNRAEINMLMSKLESLMTWEFYPADLKKACSEKLAKARVEAARVDTTVNNGLHETFLTIRKELISLLPGKVAGIAENPAPKIKANPPGTILAFLRVIDVAMTSNGIDWKKVDEFIKSRSDLNIPEMLVREAGQNQRPQASYLLAILALRQDNYAEFLAFMAQCKLQNIDDTKNDHQFFATAIKYYESLEKKVGKGGATLTVEELIVIQKQIDVIRKIDTLRESIPDALLPTKSSGPMPLKIVWEKTVARTNDLKKICQDNIDKAREKLKKQAEAQTKPKNEPKTEPKKEALKKILQHANEAFYLNRWLIGVPPSNLSAEKLRAAGFKLFNEARQENARHDKIVEAGSYFTLACQKDGSVVSHLQALGCFSRTRFDNEQGESIRKTRVWFHALALAERMSPEEIEQQPAPIKSVIHEALRETETGEQWEVTQGLSLRTDLPQVKILSESDIAELENVIRAKVYLPAYFEQNPDMLIRLQQAAAKRCPNAIEVLVLWTSASSNYELMLAYLWENLLFSPSSTQTQTNFLRTAHVYLDQKLNIIEDASKFLFLIEAMESLLAYENLSAQERSKVEATVKRAREMVRKEKKTEKEIVARWEGVDDIEIVGEGNQIFLRKPSTVPEKSKIPHVPVTTDDALKDALFELVKFYKTQPISHKGFVSRKEGLLQEGAILPEVMTMGMEVAADYGPSEQETALGYNAYLKKNPKIQDKLFTEATKGNAYTSYLLASIYPQHQPEALVFSAQGVRKPDKKDKAPDSGIELFLKIAQQRLDTLKGNSSAREEVAQIEKAVKAVQEYHEHEKNPKKPEKPFSPTEARIEFDALLAKVSQKYSSEELQKMGITSALSHVGRRYLEEDDVRVAKARAVDMGLQHKEESVESQNQKFARYALTDPKYALRMSTVYFIGDGVKANAVLGRLLRLQAILLVHHEKPEEVELFYKMVSMHKSQVDNMFQRNLRVVQDELTPELRQQFDIFLNAAQREPYNPYTLAGFMQVTFDELSRLMGLYSSFIFKPDYKKFVAQKPAINVLMAMNQFLLTRIQDIPMDSKNPQSSQITQFCKIVSKTQVEFQKRIDYLVSTSPKKGHEDDYDWTPNIIGGVLGVTMFVVAYLKTIHPLFNRAPRIADRREAERELPRPTLVERVVDPVVEAEKKARKSFLENLETLKDLRERILNVRQKSETLSKKSEAEQAKYEKTFIESCKPVLVACDKILAKEEYSFEKAEELVTDLSALEGHCTKLEGFSAECDKAEKLEVRYKSALSNLDKIKSHVDELKPVPVCVEVKKEDLIKQKSKLEIEKADAESKKDWSTSKAKEKDIKEIDRKIELLSKTLAKHTGFVSRCQEITEAAYPIGRVDELEKVNSELTKTSAELILIVQENQALAKQHEASMKKHEAQEKLAHENLVAECNQLQETLIIEIEKVSRVINSQWSEIEAKFIGTPDYLREREQLRAWFDHIARECEELLLRATYVCKDMSHADLVAHREVLLAKRSILDPKNQLRYDFENLYLELSRREIKQAKKTSNPLDNDNTAPVSSSESDSNEDQEERNAKPAALVRLASRRDVVNSEFVHIPTAAEVARAEKKRIEEEHLKSIGWMKNPLSLILSELERHANQQEKDYTQYPLIAFYSLFYALHELQFFISTAHKLRGRIEGLEIPPMFSQDKVGLFAKDFWNLLMHAFAQLDYDSMLTCVRTVYCESVMKRKLAFNRGKLIHERLALEVARTQLWANLTKAGKDPSYFTVQGAVKRLHKTFVDLAEIIDKFVLKDPDKQQHQRRTPHYVLSCKALIMFFGQIDQDLLCNIKGAEGLRSSELFKTTLESFLARCRKTVRNLERHGTDDEKEQDAFWGQRFLDLQQDNNTQTIVFDNTSPTVVEALMQEAREILKTTPDLFVRLTKIANGEVEEKKEGKAEKFGKKTKTKFGLSAAQPAAVIPKADDSAKKYLGKKK